MPPRLPESTLHDVEAQCPQCGDCRTLMIYAPPEKVVMLRLCDSCQGLPKRPAQPPEREASLPYKDSD